MRRWRRSQSLRSTSHHRMVFLALRVSVFSLRLEIEKDTMPASPKAPLRRLPEVIHTYDLAVFASKKSKGHSVRHAPPTGICGTIESSSSANVCALLEGLLLFLFFERRRPVTQDSTLIRKVYQRSTDLRHTFCE